MRRIGTITFVCIVFRLCFFKHRGFLRETRTINTTKLCMIIRWDIVYFIPGNIYAYIKQQHQPYKFMLVCLTHIFCIVKQNKVSDKIGQFLKKSKVRDPKFCGTTVYQKVNRI